MSCIGNRYAFNAPNLIMDSESSVVQQVTKASSDKLLSKFAELDSSEPARKSKSSSSKLQLIRGPIERKRLSSRRGLASTTNVSSSSYGRDLSQPTKKMKLAERKSLLLPTTFRRRSTAIVRPIGRAREIYAVGVVMAVFEKTWRKTLEGASRIMVERHCGSSHTRLLSDVV
ncbi:hypothetical protein ZOSMA_54G01220 [Zostera marina]|uniref:Uncharacterized protein n=1 Tax=Zostera marina TaxID=29655 RepID=A0A0K9NWQ4_ZOSMR|nr:hypothetical protein ZOSMA_54G01220 [Zostera marina]